ncbi:SAM-dependent methyltransferase [Crossiella equi]|uniref:SAM-dependent methyltransferase n=1 Tax=Crossiella equi TaxID=130796 RepID=A0ABS5A8G1_9PSEU|nr:class I SAM-dependent methyltransferase [Crossiella equi]MBP2472596.1 SAM-dependent methyltransferase [Crossiella equi]
MSVAAQEAFLRSFHATRPAVTTDALGAGRVPDGRTSYQVLRDTVSGRRRVLDLGCGDGYLLELLAASPHRRLTGLDLSPEALAAARARPALAQARLLLGRAQEMPFPADSFDACVSHMALMLMAELDQVAAEIARVLEPGGVLAVVLGGGGVPGTAYEVFLDLTRAVLEEVPEDRRMPALGDQRARSREGLSGVLGAAGFAPLDWRAVRLDLTGPFDAVWLAMSGIYDLDPLDSAALATLRTAFDAAAPRLPDGRVPCAMTLHVAVTRLPRSSGRAVNPVVPHRDGEGTLRNV